MFRKLDDTISVAAQIDPADLAEAKRQGFVAIVNNRPDGEQPGQPTDAEMAAAAGAQGLAYVAIPITHAGFTDAQVTAMGEALAAAGGPVLAYCRSGTRSTYVWALARAAAGDDAAALTAKAAAAGYDISGLWR
ncbi:TIGR01244 family sulfur transferase [Sphingomonas solaris]|uniref:TIGR01244 family phosphatase n=1 Tax=Alterirhizorhabdus solaris TaxID=2529389 RepID=A0A558QTW0_9SPHN|nr:TIGR01244 family sulfur transferase [Sphingomonas solaris]TVV70507.1 TIGR01244 family phosphatase [Sphingomonas solaris]